MPKLINKSKVRESFSRAAKTYDQWAEPQRRMASGLCRLLRDGRRPKTILELGCGTGILTAHLRRMFPEARILAIDFAPGMIEQCKNLSLAGVQFELADAEEYCPREPADLIVGNSSFQWFEDFDATANRLIERLSAKGRLAFAVPVVGSLPELCESYRRATGREMPATVLRGANTYRAALMSFDLPAWQEEDIVVHYDRPQEALLALKEIGATGISNDNRPLARRDLKKLLDYYAASFAAPDGLVPCTYKVLYAIATPGTKG